VWELCGTHARRRRRLCACVVIVARGLQGLSRCRVVRDRIPIIGGALEPRDRPCAPVLCHVVAAWWSCARVVVVAVSLGACIVVVAWATVSVPSSQRGGTVLTLSSSWRGVLWNPCATTTTTTRAVCLRRHRCAGLGGCVPIIVARGTMWRGCHWAAVLGPHGRRRRRPVCWCS